MAVEPWAALADVADEDDQSLSEDEGDGSHASREVWEHRAEERAAAEELLRASQMRIECVKVCAPAQLQELVEGAHAALARVRGVKQNFLRRLHPAAAAEHAALLTQWQQRSGTIRVVVRVRPMVAPGLPESIEQEEPAVKILPGAARHRGITVAIPRRGRAGAEEHSFRRLDYVLSSDKGQEAVFHELRAMLPSASPGGLAGPPQSACILAYGQTGSGKTHTMHGGSGEENWGLVPRVLSEVFQLAGASGATVSLSAVEIYNDTAYDLLDGAATSAGEAANESAGRAFSAGRLPPPPGLNFRLGCQCALGQATSVDVLAMEEAEALLLQAAERRSTRSTCFNATSSRSHSLVFVHASLPGAHGEPALRLAFVDLAGSERLPAEAGGAVAEESRHINLSLSALGSVIHALRHRANHLPYRACLLTRLLEPFFKASGRVLLCVCISPERRHAQETLCSMAFADRASRATLGAESAQEVQRGEALDTVRELHAVLRMTIRDLIPQCVGMRNTTRLPDWLAAEVLAYMPEHGGAMFVCRAWAEMCLSYKWWGRVFRKSPSLATRVLHFLSSKMEAAGVCKTWWQATGCYRVTMEASSAKVLEAGQRVWSAASAKTRSDIWKALLAAGGGSEVASKPLALIRECVVTGAPKPEALRQVLRRCLELRLVEVAEPGLASHVCAGLMHCTKLRALKLGLTLVPNITNLRQVLQACKQLRVLSLSSNADHLVSLQYLSEELPKTCSLRELTVGRCNTTWKDIEALCKSAKMLQHLRLPQSFIEVGGPLNPPPLVPLARLKLRCVDFRVHYGRAHKNRAWLTDDMFGILGQMRHLRELRVDGQKLLSDRCFWFLRRHHFRLRLLHFSGCRPMCGESVFGLLHLCEGLESIRLPTIIVGQSERRLGVAGANRWCQGLRCARLREFSVDAWPSLEDSGVQMLVARCPQLRALWLRQAPRLSDDAVTYAAGLEKLKSLSLASAAGLTDRCLQELLGSRLRSLDLSCCRQLTEGAVAEFASKVADTSGPQLQSLQLEGCPNLGRAAAEALLGCAVFEAAGRYLWFPAFAGASAKQRQCRAVMLASDEEALAETRATIGMEGDVGRLRAQALNLKWQALVGEEADEVSPATKLQKTAEAVLQANQAFYAAFNSKDLDAMSKLWACEVTKWGPLLVFQDADESFKMMCSCTHPHNRRVQGRPEIVTSWNRIFSSSTLPTLQITDERVLVTSGDMAIVVCKEETSNGGLHEATNTFARSRGGDWYIVGHQAGPVMM
ncbi:unnamed protein product [Durusdinium trenchii]|uniref:Kinesin motor domain-containing protein n=1 Tax=Durusdinium trenchii TaxID=1381693 RepID=A0ABP0STU3_9DINO